jgi:hypothetical protein
MRDLPTIDIRPGVLAMVPDAVQLITAYRKTWIANGGLQEDEPLNEALGAVCAAAGWAANGAVPVPPGTVCVRLDGLADKIAAAIHQSHSGMPDCDYDSELPAAADVVLLLQSLAVPR